MYRDNESVIKGAIIMFIEKRGGMFGKGFKGELERELF